ncbi:MAG: DUF6128 domain-containing protein [Acetatifactor sp.]
MGFQRQIGYLTYYRGEERQGNCGFLRLEQKEEAWRIQIQVQKLPLRQELSGRVVFMLQEGEWAPEEIILKNGQGLFQKTGVGGDFGGLKGVCIRLGGAQELRWGESGEGKRRLEQERVRSENQEKSHSQAQSPEQEKSHRQAQSPEQETSQEKPIREHRLEQENSEIKISSAAQTEEKKSLHPERNGEIKPEPDETPLTEEKWQQLNTIYPHRQPFGDERDYLAIGPSDFVVLTEESFRMANNSFLLHGYYQFGHLVLCRTRKKGETVSYIGVPGHYTDREKQAAILYGFESFESEVEPASEGDFGYYLLRVRL